MRRQRRSITDIICENCKYLPTKRSRNKRKLIPKESDVKTFNYTTHLWDIRWLKISCEEMTMDYSQLSDFEINRMVGDIIFKGLWASKPETSGNNTNKWYYGNADTTFEPLNHLPDYCNDPSASWPIIEKYRISILDQLTEWCVDAKGVSPIFDTRPLRAAMIVFLLMQEANNA